MATPMLKDKVAVVTGAARGIGREIALLMAQHGAKVVVNDYGGGSDGTGGDHGPADEVVSAIKGIGGQAAANYDSVATVAGGQANYAAAKLGIVGLTKVTALDMARYNVTANCISPFAWTRMIGTIPTETEAQKTRVEKIKKMGPEHIAPVAVFLASEAAKEVSGQIFGVRGKEIMLFGHMRPIRNIHHDQGWTPERLAEIFPGTLKHHLVPLQTSGQYFNYDPMV